MTFIKMNIPFFDYKQFCRDLDYLRVLDKTLDSGYLIGGPSVREFESSIEKYTGIQHCVSVANATDAMEIIFSFLQLERGTRVLVPAHTMIATASAVVSAGLQPVPIDVDCASGLLTSSILETVDLKSFGACMITQLNGIASDMDRVIQLLESANVPLVEDSAQGIGVRYKGTHVGGFGVGGCLSFYPAKVLGCLGDGGALITNNTALAEYALSVRDHGRGDDLQPIHWGRNSRLDSFQARVLLERMSHLPRYISHRREIASIYNSKLSFLAKNQLLTLPPSTSLGSTDESYIRTMRS